MAGALKDPEGMERMCAELKENMVSDIVKRFNEEMNKLKENGVITRESLETTNRNYMNETHSTIVGALFVGVTKAIRDPSLVAVLGHGLRTKDSKGGRKFVPDVSIWNWNRDVKELIGVIDYESTNSSDSRIVTRNFKNFRLYVNNHASAPLFWIIITTLPDHFVNRTNWHSWDFDRGRLSTSGYSRMTASPREFWYWRYERGFAELKTIRSKTALYLLNLGEQGLEAVLG